MSEEKVINELLSILNTIEKEANKYDEQFLVNKYKAGIKMLLPSPRKIVGPLSFYRARLAETVTAEQPVTSAETYSYMPLRYNKDNLPKRGRMNLTGESIFYASSLPQTNFKEIKKDIKGGEEVYLSQWEMKPDSIMNTYSIVLNEKISESANPQTEVCITDPYIVNGPIGKYLRHLSDLLLKKEDDEERKYLVTSLLAHHIFNINSHYKRNDCEYPLYYDAIAYPSVECLNGEYNWAIKPDFVEKHIQLKYVIKGTVNNDLKSVEFENIGFLHNDSITWYELKVFTSDAQYDSFCYWDVNGKKYTSFDYNLKDLSGNKISLKDIKRFFDSKKDEIVENMTLQGAFKESLSYDNIVDELSLIKKGVYPLWISVNGWTIEIDGKQIGVSKIGALLFYKTGLEKIRV